MAPEVGLEPTTP